jgi:trehalose 6-phosphate synthase/phosphatase
VSRLIVASHRLPVTLRNDRSGPRFEPSAGGLATAMRGEHARRGGLWVGWPGEFGALSSADRAKCEADLEERGLAAVDVPASELSRYYDGFSNGVLWPLLHYLLDKVRLDAHGEWEAYRRVNERFADAICEHYREGDTIWVHDYQLMLLPRMLRELLPSASIGFFLHVPFPSPDVFAILPWREEVLTGLLGADLVGFHTEGYRDNFAGAVSAVLGLPKRSAYADWEGRRVSFERHPIGIDINEFEALAARPKVVAAANSLKGRVGAKTILLGVDRLDYTKGLLRRLLAIDRLLERRPELRERIHVVQIAVPSREKVDAYAKLRREVNEAVGRINAQHGTATSGPVQLLYRSVSSEDLSALYRAADVMLVTPLRDGMNLVAKEYVASRIDGDGVLVLSEFAGAAAELSDALLVNPYDIGALSEAIERAVQLEEGERRWRMARLREALGSSRVDLWASGYLQSLETHGEERRRRFELVDEALEPSSLLPVALPSTDPDLAHAIERIVAARRRLLLLDYDGTLVPIAERPELARPDPGLHRLLARLAESSGTEIVVVSGRDRVTLERWVGHLPIGLSAEHGLYSRSRGGAWTRERRIDPALLESIVATLREVEGSLPGSLVEAKEGSVALHVRGADPSASEPALARLRDALEPTLKQHGLELLEGKKVVEVRVRGVSKGAAAKTWLKRLEPDVVFAAGDDRTDEELFGALPGAVTVHVGGASTRARHRVGSPAELRSLLVHLAERLEAVATASAPRPPL